jgi:hypothetical protein
MAPVPYKYINCVTNVVWFTPVRYTGTVETIKKIFYLYH